MVKLIPIKVQTHSGFAADEYPKTFFIEEKVLDVVEIDDRWYQGDLNPEFPVSNYFKILASDRKVYIIKHEIKSDKWFLCG
jgi:hypothetical protein